MLRTAALAAVALLASALLGSWSAELGSRGVAHVDEAVALGTAVGGTLVAAWYALTACALLLAQLAELGRRAPRFARGLRVAVGVAGAPVLRRAAVLGVGAGLALAAVPASAGPAADDAVPHDLRPGIGSVSSPASPAAEATTEGTPAAPDAAEPGDDAPPGVPAPVPSTPQPAPRSATVAPDERTPATGPATVAPVADTGSPDPRSGSAPRSHAPAPSEAAASTAAHVVERGDSLWSIAKAHLGEGATDAEIATEWPRWYTTNRAVIGPDPHLIHPGQALLAPDHKEQR